MDDPTKRYISKIEAALRNSNYRVAEANDGQSILKDLFCECGSVECNERLNLSLEDYDRVRSHSRRFFIITGHETEGIEKVVEEHNGWSVVEKPEEMEDVLDAADAHSE